MTVLGAANTAAPELLIREVLLEGLSVLVADSARLAELYERFDGVSGGSQATTPAAFAARLRQLCAWGSADELTVRMGYPSEHARMPAVSLVYDGGGENPGSAVFGDVFTRQHVLVGADNTGDWSTQTCTQTVVKVIEYSSRIQIGTWATGPEESILVHEAVRNVLFTDKQYLADRGIRDASLSEGGIVPDRRMYPRVAYVPMLSVQLTWDLRHTRRRRVPSRVRGSAAYRNTFDS